MGFLTLFGWLSSKAYLVLSGDLRGLFVNLNKGFDVTPRYRNSGAQFVAQTAFDGFRNAVVGNGFMAIMKSVWSGDAMTSHLTILKKVASILRLRICRSIPTRYSNNLGTLSLMLELHQYILYALALHLAITPTPLLWHIGYLCWMFHWELYLPKNLRIFLLAFYGYFGRWHRSWSKRA